MECPILLNEDALRFIESYKRKFKEFPPHELDDLKLQPMPSVDSVNIKCSYFIEIHVIFEGIFSRNTLNSIVLPIKV